MAQVHAPLSTPHAPDAHKDELLARLDALLEQYLHVLDEYSVLTAQLSRQFSSGFFSLAQANFHNRSGTPYGRDAWDERVQATRKIVVTADAAEEDKFRYTAVSSRTELPSEHSATGQGKEQVEEEEEEEEKGEAEGETEGEGEGEAAIQSPENTENNENTLPPPPDPIRMFGILVPPTLRDAQKAFSTAVAGPVPELARVISELRGLEREIGRVRKRVKKA